MMPGCSGLVSNFLWRRQWHTIDPPQSSLQKGSHDVVFTWLYLNRIDSKRLVIMASFF